MISKKLFSMPISLISIGTNTKCCAALSENEMIMKMNIFSLKKTNFKSNNCNVFSEAGTAFR